MLKKPISKNQFSSGEMVQFPEHASHCFSYPAFFRRFHRASFFTILLTINHPLFNQMLTVLPHLLTFLYGNTLTSKKLSNLHLCHQHVVSSPYITAGLTTVLFTVQTLTFFYLSAALLSHPSVLILSLSFTSVVQSK